MAFYTAHVGVTLPSDRGWLLDMLAIRLGCIAMVGPFGSEFNLSDRSLTAFTELKRHLACNQDMQVSSLPNGTNLLLCLQFEFYAYCGDTGMIILAIADFNCPDTDCSHFNDTFGDKDTEFVQYGDAGYIVVRYKPGETRVGTFILAVNEDLARLPARSNQQAHPNGRRWLAEGPGVHLPAPHNYSAFN